jgi:hypothetical protein
MLYPQKLSFIKKMKIQIFNIEVEYLTHNIIKNMHSGQNLDLRQNLEGAVDTTQTEITFSNLSSPVSKDLIPSSKGLTPFLMSKANSMCKKSHVCSVCKNKIIEEIHSFCETCTDELFIICEFCIDENINHDKTHKFVLCSPDHLILKKVSSGEISERSKSSSSQSLDIVSSPRHALLKRELSKSSVLTNNTSENDSESSVHLLDDMSELEFNNIENNDITDDDDYNGDIKNSDLESNEKGKTRRLTCCKYLSTALKNSKENLSIEDVIQRCCDDENEIYLLLDELMVGNFHENFINSINQNLLNHVKILYMTKNMLSNFHPCIFSLSQIVELNLEENSFRKIPEEICEMCHLVTLNISSNNLVDLPYGLSRLSNLKKLYANFNEFRQIPPVIFDIPNLEILHIQYNKDITSFPPKDKLEKIKNLNIHIDNSPELIEKWKKYYNDIQNITIVWNHSYPNNIIDGLYLGGVQSTWNDYVYKYFNITAVFTIGRDLEPLILTDMIHKEYIIDDIDGAKMNFTILDEIHNCLQKGNRCLVHCFAGVSRSTTIVIAYLMKYKQMRLGEAYDLVKLRREQIYPNDGFWKQLILLDQHIFPEAEKIDYTNWRI